MTKFASRLLSCDNFLSGSVVKNPPAMWEMRVQSLGWEDPLDKEMAIHSSILAWEIPWIESGRLHSMEFWIRLSD